MRLSRPLSAASSASPDAGLPLCHALIVDDHPLFAQGLADILRAEGLVQQVSCATTLEQALTLLQPPVELGLILLDLALHHEAGLTLMPTLDALQMTTPVVVISSRDDETSVRAARHAGALGFLPKSAGRPALVKMVQAVSRGEPFYPTLAALPPAPIHLTPRQIEVLQLLAQGLPNKGICRQLELTEHTVKTHLKAIFSFLAVHNRTECVARARQLGLI